MEYQIEALEVIITAIENGRIHSSHSYGVPYRAAIREMAEAIYDAGFRLKSGWISVEDRLPTECENVLCFEKGKVYVAFLENAEYSAVWWDWVDYDRDDTWTERTPTHWMPLPEPPKMKGGAE